MLTIRDNFEETVKGGSPDRFVKQYEYQAWIADPLYAVYSGVPVRGTEWTNGWGVKIKFPENVPGPFPLCEGDEKVCPDVANWKDYIHAPNIALDASAWAECVKQFEEIDKNEYFPTAKVFCGMFEKCHYLMGMEDTMINFYEEPEAMHELIDYLTEWECRIADEYFKYTKPEVLFHHDDWGSQRSLFFSTEMFDEFFLPAYKKIYGYWKELGIKYIVHHSDSYAADLVPEMIEMGVDVWQGAVYENNIPKILSEFKGAITIQGGLDNGKYDKPDWTDEKIRAGLKDHIERCGKDFIIPALTMGGPESTYPGLYERVSEIIAEFDPIYFPA